MCVKGGMGWEGGVRLDVYEYKHSSWRPFLFFKSTKSVLAVFTLLFFICCETTSVRT